MPATKDGILKAALEYASYGWKIVPLYGVVNGKCECARKDDCPNPGKHPRIKKWEELASTDETQILEWWTRWPESNVGVHMGQASGLMDWECDGPEAEQTLGRLYPDGNIPVTPTYQSKRGKHRLFKWRGDLPNPDKARFKIGKLDVLTGNDGKGQQSVFPPSIRPDSEYKWLIHPSECELAEISDDVAMKAWNLFGEDAPAVQHPKSDRLKLYEQDAVEIGGRDDVIYKESCHQWRLYAASRGARAFNDNDVHAHIFQTMWSWNRAKCRPPLDDEVVRQKVESARQFMSKQAFEAQAEKGPSLAMHGLEWKEGEWWPGQWKLTVLLGDPPWYHLTVPAWAELILKEDKSIRIGVKEFRDADAVAHAIFQATNTILVDDRPGVWQALWNGTKGTKDAPSTRGIKAKLLEFAKLEEASAEWKRHVMVAELLIEKLDKASKKEEPDSRGRPVELPDGVIWVRWMKLWEEELALRKVQLTEIQILSRQLGIGPKDSKFFPASGSKRSRFVLLTPAHQASLHRIAAASEQRALEHASAEATEATS